MSISRWMDKKAVVHIHNGVLLSLKGVQPPLPFGERTRDRSPGHAGLVSCSFFKIQFSFTSFQKPCLIVQAELGPLHLYSCISFCLLFPGDSVVKNPPDNAGDTDSIPGLERSPGEGKGNPLQYPCLENPMDRGAWSTTVYKVAKSRRQFTN